MNNKSKNNSDSQTAAHPINYYKDDWILSRKSVYTEGFIIDHHIEPPDEIKAEATDRHILCYQLNDGLRQITRMDGKEYDGTSKRGSIWLKPASISGFWHWESHDEALVFAIKSSLLRKIATQNNCPNPRNIEILPVLHSRDRILDSLVLLFLEEMNNAELANQMCIEHLVDLFTVHLLRNYCTFPLVVKEYSDGLAPHKLKQAQEYINDYLDSNIRVKQLSELVGISQYHFSRMFKKSTGYTPHEYVVLQRVERAKRLLKENKLTLADVSADCGFTHQSHMGKMFVKHVGTTPKRYRNQVL